MTRKRKYCRYPSAFGKLDLMGLIRIARSRGMEIVYGRKIGMHCDMEVCLYGTPEAMAATAAGWNAAGHKCPIRKPKRCFGIEGALKLPREKWVETDIVRRQSAKVSVVGGWKFTLRQGGGEILAPKGYRALRKTELPREGDIAWNRVADCWESVDLSGHEPAFVKANCYGILRPRTDNRR